MSAHGTSREGFDAEWRMIVLSDGRRRLFSRCEIFDEADLDAALARFDELQPQARRLENAASQVDERFQTYFAARDWDAMAEMLADDIFAGRSSSGGECRDPTRPRCRDRGYVEPVADLGVTNVTSTVIATRGERLALCRARFSGRDQQPEAFAHRGCSASSRSTPTSGSRRTSCSTPTTSTPPSMSSTPATSPAKRRPCAHVVGHRAGYAALNRRELSRDDTGLRATSTIGEVQRSSRVIWPHPPCHLGPHAGLQYLHRGRASAERPRSGRHPCGAWDLARWLRRRMAGDRPSDGRRRH